MNLDRTHAAFATTHWTLLSALASDSETERLAALESLAQRYWPPVYAAARRTGRGREEAAEITQAFFTEVVLQRRLFEHAAEARGRLRSLLLTALKRYLIDRSRRTNARADGRAVALGNLDHEDRMLESSGAAQPEEAFDRRWALAALQEAMHRCERHFLSSNKAAHWRLFEARVVRPALAFVNPPPLMDAAAEAGFGCPADGAAAAQVVKARLLSLLREVVAESVESPDDADEEYGRALSLLR